MRCIDGHDRQHDFCIARDGTFHLDTSAYDGIVGAELQHLGGDEATIVRTDAVSEACRAYVRQHAERVGSSLADTGERRLRDHLDLEHTGESRESWKVLGKKESVFRKG